MHSGLELARPRRRKHWWVAVAACLLFVAALPRLAALLPAGWSRLDLALADWVLPRYTQRLDALEQQNAALHAQLARAENALAENDALRRLLGSTAISGQWQPARVVARTTKHLILAGTAAEGAAVLDPQGRYAGRVTGCRRDDTCEVALAGTDDAPCAGLCGTQAGLLADGTPWVLTGLPADCGLAAGAVVTTPGGYWLGTLAEAPQPEEDGLTARAALTDIADLDSTVFFVQSE